MSENVKTRMPLLYRRPELLAATRHGSLRIKPGGYGFAREVNAVPLAAIEFGSAMRHYPIVFAAGDHYPVAVLGLERDNCFVSGETWDEGAYVPAYLRRYPFIFADQIDDRFALAIDRAADNLVAGGTDGEPLFEDGKPAEVVRDAMEFCREFQGAHLQTDALVAALGAQDLLVQQQADARLPSGRGMRLSGFKVVDRERFEALSEDLVLAWHAKGWLALIHFHLLSLDRFVDLLTREDKRAVAQTPASPTAAQSDLLVGKPAQ